MTLTDTNSDTQTTIQMPTPVGSDNITPNQGASGTNQGKNGDDRHNMRGKTRRTEATIKSRFEIISVNL